LAEDFFQECPQQPQCLFSLAVVHHDGAISVSPRISGRCQDKEHCVLIFAGLTQAFERFFPDNLEYGIALASAQVNEGKGKDALATVAALQALPPPLSDDPRVDLARAMPRSRRATLRGWKQPQTGPCAKQRAPGDSLVVARAKLDQCWAFENLGEFDKVQGAVVENREN
jgi:hypothetical protein